ncbi:hypothetical protein [Patiriisocius sp. Uisw_017]|jgi:hypothetical protein|uniref:hypothetical protein n=1 Tax=Patiriisocius sp. Uisw_017 TaxID=3230968 RepID=UPI0039EB6DF8
MTELDFLQTEIFKGLTNLNQKATEAKEYKFAEADFETVLERASYNGLGIYSVTTWLKRTSFGTITHQDQHKKATDARWYDRAFITMKKKQEGLTYAADFKVPAKLIARFSPVSPVSSEEE